MCSPTRVKRIVGWAMASRLTISADGLRFGAVALQELQARRRRGEEVGHLDAGARGAAAGRTGPFTPASTTI